MNATKRSVTMLSPTRLRITTEQVSYDYDIEVWHVSSTHRAIELRRTDGQATYRIIVRAHRNPRCTEWACDCPSATIRGGQCKHVLAIKAGLRSAGVKV